MTSRLAATIVFGCLCLCAEALRAKVDVNASAQSAAPNLSRQQRDLLKAIVSAVDAGSQPEPPDLKWQHHVLRASDGSHYIALSVTPPPALLPPAPILVYVRLATAASGATSTGERSLVREWLQGSRVDPRMLPRSGMVIGEMPAMGAGAIGGRGASAVGSADLQAMNLQRDRARQRREEEEKNRRAALEGTVVVPSSVLPFEDFEFVATPAITGDTASIQRAITAGPGEYDLFVAWTATTPAGGTPRVHVARRSITLGPATAELGVSSVIVADRIGVRTTPYSAGEQRGHPYSIGATEIIPARDTIFTPDERLAAAFQILNALPDETGKPDIIVNLRVVRVAGTREEPLASLSPLVYNAASLPADFDVRLGHPLIAALAVPLATIPRGTHRLLITIEDRIAKAVVASRAEFTVVGSASSLLAEAPALGPRFDLATALDRQIIRALIDRLTPASPSAGLSRALSSAANGRFADLLIEDRVAAGEEGARSALTGLALLSLGDLGAIAHFERAQAQRVDGAVVDYLLGVARAVQNRDVEALERWAAARSAGLSVTGIDRVLAEAYLRRREFAQAANVFARSADAADNPALGKLLAAARIGERRSADAVAILDAVLAKTPDDLDARWLLVHALYSAAATAPATPRERFLAEARRYIDSNGRYAALAAAWIAVLTE
ncbi:MAG TPA: hypothetical protein VFZ31_09380 [Vicinamibacterales bacterium]